MKFEKSDEKYLQERQKDPDEYGHRDHWRLYCGISNLARALIVSDIIRGNLYIPGHIKEFGSWWGSNLLLMAKVLRIFGSNFSKMVRSFAGLTEFTPEYSEASKLQGTFEELKDIIDLCEMSDEDVFAARYYRRNFNCVFREKR